MISLRRVGSDKREGWFKSYRSIGEYLAKYGEEGDYYAIPSGIKSLAGMRLITVKLYNEDELDGGGIGREICMEGSYY